MMPQCLHHWLSPNMSLLQGLKHEMDIDVRVVGVTNSSDMLLSEQGLSLTDWEQQFDRWGTVRHAWVAF